MQLWEVIFNLDMQIKPYWYENIKILKKRKRSFFINHSKPDICSSELNSSPSDALIKSTTQFPLQ